MKRLKVIVIEEQVTPKFVVPTSNFGMGSENAAIFGVPCEVVSEPYHAKRGKKSEEVIDVASCVTGYRYTIPVGWYTEHETLEEANKAAKITGFDDVRPTDIIGNLYWPKDNSYNRNFDGERADLFHKTCKIVSLPFKDETEYGEREFILINYEGKVYRTLWGEWSLYPA